MALLGVLLMGVVLGYSLVLHLLRRGGYGEIPNGEAHCSICGKAIVDLNPGGFFVSPYFSGVLVCKLCNERGLPANYVYVSADFASALDEEYEAHIPPPEAK